jgi:hypothetical protein
MAPSVERLRVCGIGDLPNDREEKNMWLRSLLCPVLMCAATGAAADPPNLAFKPAGEGLYEFNTGAFSGRLKADGKYQGVYPVIDAATGADLTPPPGVFSPYRVFTTNRRFGNGARDWPTVTRLLDNGGVELRWPAAEEHPLELTAVYRWTAPDTLDFEIAVKPQQAMPGFELFMSSYFAKGFRASVYLQGDAGKPAGFAPVDRTPDSRGGYVMFPKDEAVRSLILDGRWTIPPSPVDWAMPRHLAAPLALRRDESQNLTALMMCPPGDCFAVASPWNPDTPEAGGYRSLYQSLFGRDLAAGESARARCRLILRRNLSNEDAIRCYREYAPETNERTE